VARAGAIVVALVSGCGGLEDEDLGWIDDSAFVGTEREELIESETGYARGEAVDVVAWELRVPVGRELTVVETPDEIDPNEIDVSAHAAPPRMFVFFDSSNRAVLSQYPIVDAFSATTTSGLWEVVAVGMPSDYETNAIKSADTLFAADYGLQFAVGVVACVPVANDATLQVPAGSPEMPVISVWYRKRQGRCVLADGGSLLVDGGLPLLSARTRPLEDDTVVSVVAMPLYELRASAFGDEETIDGNRIVGALPSESDYSPLGTTYAVPVPADYEPGTITSFGGVDEALLEIDRDTRGNVVVQVLTVIGGS